MTRLFEWMIGVLGRELPLDKMTINEFTYLTMAVISTCYGRPTLRDGKKIKIAFVGLRNIIIYVTDTEIRAVKPKRKILDLSLENELYILRSETQGIPAHEMSFKYFVNTIFGYTIDFIRQLQLNHLTHLSRFIIDSRNKQIKLKERERKCYSGRIVFDIERCEIVKQ